MDGTKECVSFFLHCLLKYKTLLEPHTCFLFWLLVCVFLPILWLCIAYNCLFDCQSSSETFHTKFSVYPAKLWRSRTHCFYAMPTPLHKWSFKGQRRSDGQRSI